jgi:hypothetical protein
VNWLFEKRSFFSPEEVDFRVSLFSPTHKRTEGRPPVWGSEFTSKVAKLQGDLAEVSSTPNEKLCISVVVVLPGCELPLFSSILFSNLLNLREKLRIYV